MYRAIRFAFNISVKMGSSWIAYSPLECLWGERKTISYSVFVVDFWMEGMES